MIPKYVYRPDQIPRYTGILERRNIIMMMFIAFNILAVCKSASAQELSQDPPLKRPCVALVLAGGGALGFAHVGVMDVLEAMGIPIDIVVGTSMGATIGGFYSLGYSPSQMKEIIHNIDWSGLFSEQVNSSEDRFRTRIDRSRYFANVEFDGRGLKIPGSVLTGRKLLYFLDRMTLAEHSPVDFDSLPRRFRAVSADLQTGERVVIGNGSLADAMRASMGIPGVFSPYMVGGRFLVDGGIVDNLPVGTARNLGADLIIAVDLIGGTPFAFENFERNPVDVLSRSLDIMIQSNVQPQLLDADIVLSVDLSGYQATDFQKAAEIIIRGEMTARTKVREIEAFKARLGTLAPGTGTVERLPATEIQHILVEGGTKKGRMRVMALFDPILGTIPDDEFMERTIAKLESEGIYESIRIQRYGEPSDPTLKISLSKRDRPGHTIQLGIKYASTYSASMTSVSELHTGVVFRGLTSDDSRLALSLRILDSPAFKASFIQPISSQLFIEGQLKAFMQAAVYRSDLAMSYLYQTKALDIGFNIGLHPAEWAEISTGFSYEWVQQDDIPDFRTGAAIGSVPLGHILVSLRRFDSPVFPSEGFSILLRYDQSLSESGSSRFFRTLVSEGQIIPQLGLPFSVTTWWRAGTDLSIVADSNAAAPLYHKPDLANRQFFPGPLEFDERVGSHIAGLGIEAKFQFNSTSSTIGFPSFGLLQMAAGTAIQDSADMDRISDFMHIGAAIGLGVRINDGFGASFRIGATRGFDDNYRLFTSLDLGSFGY